MSADTTAGRPDDPSRSSDPGTDSDSRSEGPFDCPYCDRRFAREEWLALHRGLEHGERVGETEREAFEAAYDAEAEGIRLFQLKALAVLVLVYFGFLLVYAFVL